MYLSFPEIVIVDECPLSPTCIMWVWTGTDFICKIVAILLLWSLLRTKLWLIFVSLNSYTEIVERPGLGYNLLGVSCESVGLE